QRIGRVGFSKLRGRADEVVRLRARLRFGGGAIGFLRRGSGNARDQRDHGHGRLHVLIITLIRAILIAMRAWALVVLTGCIDLPDYKGPDLLPIALSVDPTGSVVTTPLYTIHFAQTGSHMPDSLRWINGHAEM